MIPIFITPFGGKDHFDNHVQQSCAHTSEQEEYAFAHSPSTGEHYDYDDTGDDNIDELQRIGSAARARALTGTGTMVSCP